MTELKKTLQVLKEQMKKQECYKKYLETLKVVQKNPELYEELNNYRRKNVELHWTKRSLESEAKLSREFRDLLGETVIQEFLYWEQETLKMIQMVQKEMDESLKLDYSFLD